MNLFYTPNLSVEKTVLDPEESRHCTRVLRLTRGDRVHLLDGRGKMYEAVIDDPDPKGCRLTITSEVPVPAARSYKLTVAIAPTKNTDRFEWFLEKATEIGIDRIIPVICRHSERKDIKPERLEKILVAAMKQSGQLLLPELTPVVAFRELVIKPFSGDKMIAHCEPTQKNELSKVLVPGRDVMVLIGPEGDFDPSEISQATANGFVPVSLGNSRLRTETAGLVACHTVCLMNR